MTENYLRSLQLFNEKAEKLLQSRFVKFVRETKRFTVEIRAKRGEAVKLTKKLPDQHAIDEFVLTFRFFIQDNEKSSFRNMTKLYEEMPISQNLKEEFFDLARRLNEYLDSEPSIKLKIDEQTYLRRTIMEVFIYGSLAHANLSKKNIYDKWRAEPITFSIIEFEFNTILETILRAIRIAEALNKKAIEELS